jgi:beta-N-acetylglucosaminidase
MNKNNFLILSLLILCLLVIELPNIKNQEPKSTPTISYFTPTSVIVHTPIPSPTPTKNKFQEELINGEEYLVKADILHIREFPNLNSIIVNKYFNGDIITIIGSTSDKKWFKTDLGWVSSQYVEKLHKKHYLVSRGIDEIRPITNIYSSITSYSNLGINELKQLTENTNLKGIEKAILDIEEEYGINAFFTLAVAKLESAHGRSKIAIDKNNLFGLNAIDKSPYRSAWSFETKSQSVYKFGEVIKNVYLDKDIKTIFGINKLYCTNNKWGKLVVDIIKYDFKNLAKDRQND